MAFKYCIKTFQNVGNIFGALKILENDNPLHSDYTLYAL